jgi:CRP-like cAMP-binding protein
VILQGDRPEGYFVLESGKLEVVKDGIKVASLHEAGTVFGEIGYILGEPATATVNAVLNSRVIQIVPESLSDLIRKNPERSQELLVTLAKRLKRTTKHLANVAQESTGYRRGS